MRCDSETRIRSLRAALLRIADDVSLEAPPLVRNIAKAALRQDAGGALTHGVNSYEWSLCDGRWVPFGIKWRDRGKWDRIDCPACLQRLDGTPISKLGRLSTRLANILHNERIFTIEWAESLNDVELLRVPNAGRKSIEELRKAIANWRRRNRQSRVKSAVTLARLGKVRHDDRLRASA